MQVKIENDRVHQNVLIFLELVSRHKASAEKENIRNKMHTAFVNRINGEIYFLDLLPNSHALNGKDWKRVQLCCLSDSQDQHLTVELQEKEGQASFQYEDLTPLAYKVMTETLRTLNHITQSFKKNQGWERSFDEWEDLEIQFFPIDMIEATWHDVDRWEAETILEKHPYGSYLFRKDEYASLLAENLQRQLKRKIVCYTLTFSEPHRKISDLTIVQDGNEWLIYNDDPSLAGKKYPTLEPLLNELKERCRIPLFH
ncbi:MAG: hypothetical protein K2P51_06530 [Rhabdochlamydiaceae bacterium]|nr:hypothetical protein [Rhabdochlamydiaceae bacterium]